ATAEELAIADGDHEGLQRVLFTFVVVRCVYGATNVAKASVDERLERCTKISCFSAKDTSRIGDVTIHESAHSGGEDVYEIVAGLATTRELADIERALFALRDRVDVPIEAMLDAERLAEIAAGALTDNAKLRGITFRSVASTLGLHEP